MQRHEGIRVGSYFGAPIILAYSWFLAFVFIILVFGSRFGQSHLLPNGQGYLVALVYALMLFFSVFIHEMAHAAAARSFGFTVQRITLNLWGGFTQFTERYASPAKSLITALVGPITNFIVALLIVFVRIVTDPGNYLIDEMLYIFFWMNIVLGVFNIMPGAPLDGGQIVETTVWKLTGNRAKGMIASGWAGRIMTLALIFLALLPLLQGQEIRFITLAVMIVLISTVWIGSTQTINAGRIMLRASLVTAAGLARKIVVIDPRSTVADLKSSMAAVSYDPREQAFAAIGADGKIAAIVDDKAVSRIPVAQEQSLGVEAVLQTVLPAMIVPESMSGQELFQETAVSGPHGVRYYVVVDSGGRPVGIFDEHAVSRAIR